MLETDNNRTKFVRLGSKVVVDDAYVTCIDLTEKKIKLKCIFYPEGKSTTKEKCQWPQVIKFHYQKTGWEKLRSFMATDDTEDEYKYQLFSAIK
jgi:hypothetical protein